MPDSQLTRATEFMNREVKDYIEGDLNKLLNTTVEPDGTGGLAVPIGLTCFSIMDYFGFLTRAGANVQKEKTADNITHFIEHYFPRTPNPPPPADLLIKIFRHGLMHQFFPKACGISSHPHRGIIVGLVDAETSCMYVKDLANAVLFGLNEIRKELAGRDGIKLAKTMNERLDHLIEEDHKALADLKHLIKSYLASF